MKKNVVAPTVGESITEVRIGKWLRKHGESVKVGDVVLEIESDKATVEVVAEAAGVLNITKEEGATVPIGEVLGFVDTDGVASASSSSAAGGAAKASAPAAVAMQTQLASNDLSPAVRKLVVENQLNPAAMGSGTGKDGRLTKGDVLGHLQGGAQTQAQPAATAAVKPASAPRALKPGERKVAMTTLRAKIAERLVMAQHTAAILTTFNEADMSAINELRKKYKDSFKAKYGVSLGFMSFFTKSCVLALKAIPEVNAYVEGNDVIYHDYCHVGIAVGSEKGLVVPVVRNADQKSFVEVEQEIAALALKARDGKLSIADMSEGTFTISNGGVYGSLMSTPILNPPQSGILGMHKIQERPIAVDGKVVIKPMMYLALSYDHRIIDGKGAVTFLVTVKDYLENPSKLGLEFLNGL